MCSLVTGCFRRAHIPKRRFSGSRGYRYSSAAGGARERSMRVAADDSLTI